MYEVNQKTLALALGISSRQVRDLRSKHGMFPFIPDTKKYDLTSCVNEYINFKVGERTGKTSVDREKEMAEHEQIKKEIAKLKLRKIRRDALEARDVENYLKSMLVEFRNRLLAVPSRVAPILLGETDINVIIKTLDREMFDTLDELSEFDPEKIAGEDFDNEDDEE